MEAGGVGPSPVVQFPWLLTMTLPVESQLLCQELLLIGSSGSCYINATLPQVEQELASCCQTFLDCGEALCLGLQMAGEPLDPRLHDSRAFL
jgi:hypothetical protein